MNDWIRKSDALAAAQDASDNSDEPQDVVSAIAALPAVTVGVRPLVWKARGVAKCALGKYHIIDLGWHWEGKADRFDVSLNGADISGQHDEASAKAAAQADYEARILAALEPVAAPAQCCMCGKRDLSTAEDGGPECQMNDGRWVCSRQCYYTACSLLEQQPAPDPAAIREAALRLMQIYDSAMDDLLGEEIHRTHPDSDEMAEIRRVLGAPALIQKGAADDRA